MVKKLKKIKIVILIYARLNSKRLPKKVLIKINSKNIIDLIVERIKKVSKYKLPIIVCTSTNQSDNKIINYCKEKKIKFFRGNLNNVFKRTLECYDKYRFDSFIRVCADRPFFDVKLMDSMIKKFKTNKFDVVTNQFPRTYPKGLACEMANIDIFKNLDNNLMLKSDKEHIFNFFYRNSKNYKIFNFQLNEKIFRKIKIENDWSLNNKKDLLKIRKIYSTYSPDEYIDILKESYK